MNITGEEENAANEQSDEFDTNLPTTHSYLGHLNTLQGYTLYDEGTEMQLLGLFTETWVCPGYTLPLFIEYTHEINVIRNYMANNKIFVLVCYRDDNEKGYGITMEIIEASESGSTLSLLSKGRQRCEIIETGPPMSYHLVKIKVKILADIEMKSPLHNIQLPSLNKSRVKVVDMKSFERNTKLRMRDAAQTRWPLWVYNQNELVFLTKKINKLLKQHITDHQAPTDPVKLSYWFMQNFQLNDDERLKILKLNSTVERLKLELQYLQKKRVICCSSCNVIVARQMDMFAMSKDGFQNNYCNPSGHVYETVTVSRAVRVVLVGTSSSQFSWFPGYDWTIIVCANCNSHIGWQFTSNHLKPKKFFGLAKNCITANIMTDNCLTNSEDYED